MNKFDKYTESYYWVEDITNRVIIEFKKTYDMLEEANYDFFYKRGSSMTKFNVLVILYKGPDEGLMLSEIGEKMLVTKGNITGLIDRLEKEGLVQRVRDDNDRRKIMAVISDKGKKTTEKLIKEYSKFTDNLLKAFSDYEKNKIVEVLQKVRNEMTLLEGSEYNG